MGNYSVSVNSNESGMIYFDMRQQASLKFLADIGDTSNRESALKWLNDAGFPMLLSPGIKAPDSFTKLLKQVPNRDKPHTVGQPLALTQSDYVRDAIVKRLDIPDSPFKDIFDLADKENTYPVVARCKSRFETGEYLDANDIGNFNIALSNVATRYHLFHLFVQEMDAITNSIPHLKRTWDERTRGTLLAVPESATLHRRMGSDTGQVVWHTDTARGFIFFCLLNDQVYPHRVLFDELGHDTGQPYAE